MRKIVGFGLSAQALRKCFRQRCRSKLGLRNTESKKRYYFASLFWVSCVECVALNSKKTSKSHHVKKKVASEYNVNIKAAGAMED